MCGGAREDVARAEKLNQVMQKRKNKTKAGDFARR